MFDQKKWGHITLRFYKWVCCFDNLYKCYMIITDCLDQDIVCQESLNTLFIAWEPFEDKESGITEYVL